MVCRNGSESKMKNECNSPLDHISLIFPLIASSWSISSSTFVTQLLPQLVLMFLRVSFWTKASFKFRSKTSFSTWRCTTCWWVRNLWRFMQNHLRWNKFWQTLFLIFIHLALHWASLRATYIVPNSCFVSLTAHACALMIMVIQQCFYYHFSCEEAGTLPVHKHGSISIKHAVHQVHWIAAGGPSPGPFLRGSFCVGQTALRGKFANSQCYMKVVRGSCFPIHNQHGELVGEHCGSHPVQSNRN